MKSVAKQKLECVKCGEVFWSAGPSDCKKCGHVYVKWLDYSED